MEKKTVAVDFDGVIHKYSNGWQDGAIYDEPVEGAIDALNELTNSDILLVIYSTRADSAQAKLEMRKWLDKQGFNAAATIEITNKKPKAIIYIDDRAIRFTNWKDMLNYLK